MCAAVRNGVGAHAGNEVPNQHRLEFPPDDCATIFLGGGQTLRGQFREEFRCLSEVQAVAVLRELFDDRL
jgi:hypothetical protein